MQGLGGTGTQQSQDCSFAAGKVSGAPLRVSWFLVIFFVYQLIDAVNLPGAPLWFRVGQVSVNQILLLVTILCHEMGHGTMARQKGGQIAEVLLWPFGGICFTTRPFGRTAREKLVDELWIVGAGPATHFPMAAVWVAVLALFVASSSHVVLEAPWRHLIPFSGAMGQCVSQTTGCFHTWLGLLVYTSLVQAVQLNVMLFMFNVFFPMYPMDGAKLICCSLQLFFDVSADAAAKVLIFTSVPLALFFIGFALLGAHGGGIQPGITMFLGLMCLAEAWKIYRLMQEGQLQSHPLFELARRQPPAASTTDGPRSSRREEEQRVSSTQFSTLRPFPTDSGRVLGSPAQSQV